MKVLVLSDIHDHIDKLQKVLIFVVGKVEAAVFVGISFRHFLPASWLKLTFRSTPVWATTMKIRSAW